MLKQGSAKQERIQTIEWLIEYFPTAFFKHPRDIKPLKIGVFDDIMDFYERLDSPPCSKKKIREALNYYSASPAYLRCQEAGVARIDLYGNEVDVVSEDQAKYAHQRFQERYTGRRKDKVTTPDDVPQEDN